MFYLIIFDLMIYIYYISRYILFQMVLCSCINIGFSIQRSGGKIHRRGPMTTKAFPIRDLSNQRLVGKETKKIGLPGVSVALGGGTLKIPMNYLITVVT